MKVYDIISESVSVDEAPMGMMNKLGSKLQSKLPGDWGAAGKSKLNVGGEANRLKKDLVTYMSGSGIPRGQLTPDQFVQFLNQVGLEGLKTMSALSAERSAEGIEPDAPMTKEEVDQYLLKATQTGFQAQGMKSRKSKFASPPSGAPSGASTLSPAQLAQMTQQLKQAGYTVTNP